MKVISFSARIGENAHAINIWLSLYNHFFYEESLIRYGSLFSHYNSFLFYVYRYIYLLHWPNTLINVSPFGRALELSVQD